VTSVQALRAGFGRAFSRPWPALALFAAGAGEVFASSAAGLLLFQALGSGDRRALWSGAVGLLAGWAACRAARAVIYYAALSPAPPEGAALLRTSARALGYLGLSTALELLVRAWWWTAVIASGMAYLGGVGKGGAAMPALALSVALVGGAALGLFATVWSDLGLARSTGRGEPFSASLAESARFLAERPLAPLAIVAVTGIARWVAEMSFSALPAVAGPVASAGAPRLALAARVTAGLVAALAWAVLELSRISALQALELAPPPPAPPVPAPPVPAPPTQAGPVQAEPILDAVPVNAPGRSG
jgi:hypothetical protein